MILHWHWALIISLNLTNGDRILTAMSPMPDKETCEYYLEAAKRQISSDRIAKNQRARCDDLTQPPYNMPP